MTISACWINGASSEKGAFSVPIPVVVVVAAVVVDEEEDELEMGSIAVADVLLLLNLAARSDVRVWRRLLSSDLRKTFSARALARRT